MLALKRYDDGVFDLDLSDLDLVSEQQAFETLVYAALFTDAERVDYADQYQRRGWWHNPDAGSLLWWFRQQPLTDEVRRDAVSHIFSILSKTDKISNVVVTDVTPERSFSALILSISATYNSLEFILQVTL